MVHTTVECLFLSNTYVSRRVMAFKDKRGKASMSGRRTEEEEKDDMTGLVCGYEVNWLAAERL